MPQEETSRRADDLSARWHQKIQQRQADALTAYDPQRVDLPSGDYVMAVRVNVLSLVEAGRLPNSLTPFVLDLIRTKTDDVVKESMAKVEANWQEYLRMLDNVWLACVVEPKFSVQRVPDDPEAIPVRLVDVNDKIALFNWAQGVSDHLAAFRDPEAGVVRIVVDEPGVSVEDAGGAPGDRPQDGPVAELAGEPRGADVRPVGGQPPAGDHRGRRRSAKKRQADENDPGA